MSSSRSRSSRFALNVKPYAELSHLIRTGEIAALRSAEVARLVASELRTSGPAGMPEEVKLWLADHLEGKVRLGRPSKGTAQARLALMIRRGKYERFRLWLQRRHKRYGHLDGWPALRGKGWWQGPPAERAARIVAEFWGPGYHSWRSLQTELSKKTG